VEQGEPSSVQMSLATHGTSAVRVVVPVVISGSRMRKPGPEMLSVGSAGQS
jgi:hypothetical protein